MLVQVDIMTIPGRFFFECDDDMESHRIHSEALKRARQNVYYNLEEKDIEVMIKEEV